MSSEIFFCGKLFSYLLYGSYMKTQKFSKEQLKALGHRLKVVRTMLNLDQRQMSESMGTAQSQISKIEIGRSAPTLYQLIRVKELADQDDALRDHLTWEWLLVGKGKGIIG
jgi:DNA-binding XRE family transcriptional regulator